MTDGVYSRVSKKEIHLASIVEPDFKAFCEVLVAKVIERGADDNFTLVGVQFD